MDAQSVDDIVRRAEVSSLQRGEVWDRVSFPWWLFLWALWDISLLPFVVIAALNTLLEHV